MKLSTHILMESAALSSRWEAMGRINPKLEIQYHVSSEASNCEMLNSIIERSNQKYALVLHETAVIGAGFDNRTIELIDLLQSHVPENWGAVSNAGISIDGKDQYSYWAPNSGLDRCFSPVSVGYLGSDAILINLEVLRNKNVHLPCLKTKDAHGIMLSIECLKAGLCLFADSHLFLFRERETDAARVLGFLNSDEFGSYWNANFINHLLATSFGHVDLSRRVDYSYLDYKLPRKGLKDIKDLWRAAQAGLIKKLKPRITIVCRTMLKRQAMLSRAVQSFATAQQRAQGAEFQVKLVTTRDEPALMQTTVERLRTLAPSLSLTGEVVTLSGNRFSRTELMYRNLISPENDYVWFVDDDDFVFADSVREILLKINISKNNVILGDSIVYEEEWESNENPEIGRLSRSERKMTYAADQYLKALSGVNYIPVCSVVFPTALMKKRLENVAAAGDYNEDYFFLCLALSAPNVDVRLTHNVIAGISYHNCGNTVTETDRTNWNLSYATFFGELLNLPNTGNNSFWKLASFHRNPPAPTTAIGPSRQITVYVPKSGTYSEDAALTQPIYQDSEFHEYTFSVENASGAALRIDVGNCCAVFKISTLQVIANANNPEYTIVDGRASMILNHQVCAISKSDTGDILFAYGCDPQILIPLPSGDCSNMQVKVRLKYMPLGNRSEARQSIKTALKMMRHWLKKN